MTDKTYTGQELEEMADQLLTADDKKKDEKTADKKPESAKTNDKTKLALLDSFDTVPCRCSAGRQ